MTLLFNTDGIHLYKSSKVNIWPVFLAINELPLEERFVKKKSDSLGIVAGEWKAKVLMEQSTGNMSKVKYEQSGGFLTNEDNLTLLFNTDGIHLYKSSKVNIWPVFLAINELPLEERFVKKI